MDSNLTKIPQQFRSVFHEFSTFNSVQNRIFDDCFLTDESVVVSAPTGSGKTVAFELAILRILNKFNHRNFKIVYMAPMKALCSEKYDVWFKKFSKFNVKSCIVTGDGDYSEFNELLNYQLLLTTPEKWDSLTRKWKESPDFVKSIVLFMIDEIHLLNEAKRGAVLETVICRMKTMINFFENKSNSLRIIAVSATMPNAEDVAQWIGFRTRCHKISECLRPIKLDKHVFGYKCFNGYSKFQFDMHLTYKIPSFIDKFGNKKPTMIFCSTRRGVEMTAEYLSNNYKVDLTSDQLQSINEVINRIKTPKLSKMIKNGVSFHHAGLSFDERNIVENLFKNNIIPILVCTNTLAMGVNLPAFLVIIRSTNIYTGGANEQSEYSELDILQMIGRAGRPQFDSSGTAVIITEIKSVEKYKNLVNGTRSIESNLDKNLVEHLNSEIVLETICSPADAVSWLKSTFFFVRAMKNPNFYNLSSESGKTIEDALKDVCSKAIDALESNGLISKGAAKVLKPGVKTTDFRLSSTLYGRLMAKYFISFETMYLFRQLNGAENLEELFTALCNCFEFQEFNLRVSDKKVLNELNDTRPKSSSASAGNSEAIRFSLAAGKINTVSQKISCLLQAQVGNVTISDSGLLQEAQKIYRLALRLIKCLFEFTKIRSNENSNYFQALVSTLILKKCLEVKMWENSQFLLKQLPKIGPVTAGQLARAGIDSFAKVSQSSPHEIERILRRQPPFGTDITEMVMRLPTYSLTLRQAAVANAGKTVKVNVRQLNGNYEHHLNDEISLIVGDSGTNRLYLHKDNLHTALKTADEEEFSITIDDGSKLVVAHLIHHSIVGLDQKETLTLDQARSRQQGAICEGDWRPAAGDGSSVAKRSIIDTLKEFEFAAPRKIPKLEEFTIDHVFDDMDSSFEPLKQIENQELLSLTAAHSKFLENQNPTDLEGVLTQIIGQSQINSSSRSFQEIMMDDDADEDENFKESLPQKNGTLYEIRKFFS